MADTAYTIRPFPQELHRKAKATAALEGITLKKLILKALAEYVDRQQSHMTGGKPTLAELLLKWIKVVQYSNNSSSEFSFVLRRK